MSVAPYDFAGEPPVRDITQRLYKPRSRHQEMMDAFHGARDAWSENREKGEHMQMEDDDYKAKFKPPVLGDYMGYRK